ncbi:hypothetical protein C731_4173 [Mycolicibacterium hassiacum DSM 44199]|uniref:Uncharacterized protein n=1 Tax=Mycolicibacterium hassiacum (strain DSM 44199 / CIP 105218 / JCM 12690 / 3849) TaxID=1122247 RepID=K5B7F5_MYCHD|nr:hypothetical protein C731_4173 [Mycolicibacterium hassiacum DSM 44199]VCT92665.1 hypothetical protein MHAS_04395 [Mycolicibacterium hassiacum DSM 44199]
MAAYPHAVTAVNEHDDSFVAALSQARIPVGNHGMQLSLTGACANCD